MCVSVSISSSSLSNKFKKFCTCEAIPCFVFLSPSQWSLYQHMQVFRGRWSERILTCSLSLFSLKIFVTAGDKSQGGTHVLYDPTLSERGALVCVARAPRKKSVDDFEAKPVIHNPHALPLFREQPSRKRQREKILKDPIKSHKPELPMTGPGFGGRVGSTKGSLLTQYLLKVMFFWDSLTAYFSFSFHFLYF